MRSLRVIALLALVGVAALVVVACGGEGPDEAVPEAPVEAPADAAAEAPADAMADPAPGAPGEPSAEHVYNDEIAELLNDPNLFLLDVRNPEELAEQGAIEGYTLIPIDELADRLDELPKDRPILTL